MSAKAVSDQEIQMKIQELLHLKIPKMPKKKKRKAEALKDSKTECIRKLEYCLRNPREPGYGKVHGSTPPPSGNYDASNAHNLYNA
jgi:hypothetical protein